MAVVQQAVAEALLRQNDHEFSEDEDDQLIPQGPAAQAQGGRMETLVKEQLTEVKESD